MTGPESPAIAAIAAAGAHGGRPDADVEVTPALVRALLAEQHPDLSNLPLSVVAEGWDNAMLRLGDELVVRLPRRAGSVVGLENEQRWLAELAPSLPQPIPVPVRIGVPGAGYPYPWTIAPWLDGLPATERPLTRAGQADLAAFLRALHLPAPAGAPHNLFRGIALVDRAEAFGERLARAAARGVDVSAAERHWSAGLAAPIAESNVWLHGDVHCGNLLTGGDGRLAAVLDWNDVCAGDPASDLAAAWLVATDPGAFLAAYGPVSPALRARSAAWAAYLALMFLEADAPGDTQHRTTAEGAFRRLAID